MIYRIFIFISVLVLSQCKFKNADSESIVLNDLLNSRKTFQINLDKINIDTVEVDLFINFDDDSQVGKENTISRVIDLKFQKDNLYIFDNSPPLVSVFDLNGVIKNSYLSLGNGPGEVNNLSGVSSLNEGFLITDASNMRVNIFDKGFELVQLVTSDEISYTSTSKILTIDDNILFPNGLNSNYSSSLVSLSNNSLTQLKEIHPKLIPQGYQPMAVNNYTASWSHSLNLLSISNFGTPYIFNYTKNADLRSIIELRSVEFKNSLSSLKPIKNNSGDGSLVKSIIIDLLWKDDYLIVVTGNHVISIIKKVENDFILLGRVKYKYKFGEDLSDRNLKFLNLLTTELGGDYLYITSVFDNGIYKINMDSLITKYDGL